MRKLIKIIFKNQILLGNILGSGIFFFLVILLSLFLNATQYKEFIIQYSAIQAISNIGIFGINSIIIHEYSKKKESIISSALLCWVLNFIISAIIIFILYDDIRKLFSFINYEILFTGFLFGLVKILIFLLIPLNKHSTYLYHSTGIRLLISIIITLELFQKNSLSISAPILLCLLIYIFIYVPHFLRNYRVDYFNLKFIISFYKNSFPFLILAIINLGSGHALNAIIADKILLKDVKLFSILFQSIIIIPIVFNGLLDQRLLIIFKELNERVKFSEILAVKKITNAWIFLFFSYIIFGSSFYFIFESTGNYFIVLSFLLIVSISGFKSFLVNILIFHRKNYLYLFLTAAFNASLIIMFEWQYKSLNINQILCTYVIILSCYLLTLFISVNNHERLFY